MTATDLYYFDPSAVDRVATFFSKFLKHTKGQFAGKPFDLLPYQVNDIIGPLYGWKKKTDGLRRYRKCHIELPKKNGKSTLLAGLGLYMLLADGEPGAECYVIATSREQASLIYDQCCHFVEGNSALSSVLRLVTSTKKIVYPDGKGLLRVLSTESATVEGIQASCILADELHRWEDDELYSALRYATVARRQPLFLQITTAGNSKECLWYRERSHAFKVRKGEAEDDTLLPVIYSAEGHEKEWDRVETFALANPSFGVIHQAEEVKQAIAIAKADPVAERDYLRYRLNILCEDTIEDFVSLADWDGCEAPLDIEEGAECFAAVDLGFEKDLSALVLGFPYSDGSVAVLPYFWTSEEAARKRERLNKTRYDAWIRAGHMFSCPGDIIDPSVIRAFLDDLANRYRIREVAFDKFQALEFALGCEREGRLSMVEYGQTYGNMTGPIKLLNRLVAQRKIRHAGNPVLRWNLSNVVLQTDNTGLVRPTKKGSRDKVDGAVCVLMMLGRLILHQPSMYETQGLLLV